LENFDKNHLAKVLLGRSARTVRPNHFCDQRIKLTDQRPSCLIIMPKRSLNQRACVRIIHVVENASTPLTMTDGDTLWLQFVCRGACAKHLSLIAAGARRGERRYTAGQKNFVTAGAHVRSSSLKARRAHSKQQTLTMKRNLLTVVVAGAIALGGFVVVQAQAGPGGPCGHGHAFGLQGITKQLNLTSDQQTKVQPLVDAAKPQIVAIHQEAMQKMKTVMDSTLSQVRPLLNPDQQKKLDDIQKAHQDMMNAHKELHNAMQE
jgi:Spy/CpxP family protein refolding chaperone